jgi:hypothetical protein
MKFRTPVMFLLIASLLTASGLSVAQEESSELAIEGFQLVEDSNLALVYAQPGIDWGQYSKIYLDTPYIDFKENWQRDQNRDKPGWVSDDDMAKIKIELSSLFTGVFSETLLEGGYELVYESGEDVLLIRPAIIGLDIVAPETNSPGISRTYSETAGEMTLYLELYDSVSGEMLAKALDRQMDRQTGYFEWQNRVTNRAAANRILKVWAKVLKEGLDDARASTSSKP